jgi:hypothetical protein
MYPLSILTGGDLESYSTQIEVMPREWYSRRLDLEALTSDRVTFLPEEELDIHSRDHQDDPPESKRRDATATNTATEAQEDERSEDDENNEAVEVEDSMSDASSLDHDLRNELRPSPPCLRTQGEEMARPNRAGYMQQRARAAFLYTYNPDAQDSENESDIEGH